MEKAQSIVLAVEPDTRTAEIMRNMLTQDGYTVIIVPTAQEALEVLRTPAGRVHRGSGGDGHVRPRSMPDHQAQRTPVSASP